METKGIWLGVTEEIGSLIQNDSMRLDTGDTALLFTDGITEATNEKNEMFSEKKLKNVFYLTRSNTKKACVEKLEGIDFLRSLLEINPDFNIAIFWEIDRGKKARRLRKIMNSLTEAPDVYRIKIPKRKKYVSKDIYEAVSPLMG